MATTPTNSVERSPATQEFDEKLAKMYDKILVEINKHIKRSMVDYKINIDKIIVPSGSEQEDARIAKQFTRKRLKILDSIDTLVRTLVAGRNRVSLFDMFDQRGQMDKQYVSKYRKIKRMALNRLETGVSLVKFTDTQELPLATILFPTRNTKLYAARFELLKQMLLTRVSKGIKNMTFVAPAKHKSFKLTRIEKTRAEVPLADFIIPTPNSNLFTVRYNWSKHVLLSKVHKGIKNLQFVALTAVRKRDKSGEIIKTKLKPTTTKLDVPLDSFLIPSGNTWYYAARYELAKLKLLRKVRKGINSIHFSGGDVDIMERFFPKAENEPGEANTVISKAIARIMKRESKARIKSVEKANKLNEYSQFKRDRRADYWIHLDEKRNEMMANAWFGAGKRSRVINTKMNKEGVFEPDLASKIFSGQLASSFAAAIGTKLMTYGPTMGKALGVAAAAYGGYKLGQFIDQRLGTSEAVGALAGMHAESKGYKEYVKNVVEPGLARDADTKFIFNQLQRNIEAKGEKLKGAHGQALLYDKARELAKQRMQQREAQFLAAGYTDYTTADLRSLKPVDYIVKTARNEPITLAPPMPMPAGAVDYFLQGSSMQNMPQLNILIDQNKQMIDLQKKNQGTTIYNPHPSADFVFESLDANSVMK